MRSKATTAAPADPELERKLWKQHFERLQAGREHSDDKVWANVRVEQLAAWLEETPTQEEIHACGRKMRNGKAAGCDVFFWAEVYKYGSPLLQQQVRGIVQVMWEKAMGALPGRETYDWPPELSQ